MAGPWAALKVRTPSNAGSHFLCDPPDVARRQAEHVREPTKGVVMGREARIGLLLGAAACLLAVMVDWVIEDLNK